jgi:hypothetical protein
MADPLTVFGVISSALSVLDISCRLGKRIGGTVQTLKNAPEEIIGLHNEVADLTLVINHVHSTCQTVKNLNLDNKKNIQFLADLSRQLHNAGENLADLDDIFNKLSEAQGFKKRYQWLKQEAVVAKKKEHLRGIRLKVHDILLSYNVYVFIRKLQMLGFGNLI